MSATAAKGGSLAYLTVAVAGQQFGLPLGAVRNVFRPHPLTPVPWSRPEIAGVLNLRGRIVTVLDMRARLGLPPFAESARTAAVGIEWEGESHGLMVDRAGEVAYLAPDALLANPPHLESGWADVSAGVHKLARGLMIILEIDKLLHLPPTPEGIALPASAASAPQQRSLAP